MRNDSLSTGSLTVRLWRAKEYADGAYAAYTVELYGRKKYLFAVRRLGEAELELFDADEGEARRLFENILDGELLPEHLGDVVRDAERLRELEKVNK